MPVDTARPPMHEFRTRRRVEFSDTDMAGIVHFSRFFVFMESAEHEFLRGFLGEVHFEYDGEEIGWPRVAAQCEYKSPARLGDVLDIHLRVARKGRRSMTYRFEFHAGDRLVALGEVSTVCCAMGPPREPRQPRPIPIPPAIAARIEESPVDPADPAPEPRT